MGINLFYLGLSMFRCIIKLKEIKHVKNKLTYILRINLQINLELNSGIKDTIIVIIIV